MRAPLNFTMSRLGEEDEVIVAQSTSQCCRCCIFQKSINWVVAEGNNYEPGTNPFDLPIGGWIHEESSLFERSLSWIMPGCRAIKYVQHAGAPPRSIQGENKDWFTCQTGNVPKDLSEEDRQKDVIATHKKVQTCGACFLGHPVCCDLPYLETSDPDGNPIGRTQYVCDGCIAVPKYDVTDGRSNEVKYHLRPDTCIFGCCILCRFGGPKGKCLRVPYIIRDPNTKEPLSANVQEGKSQMTSLWSGWTNECCSNKTAYHVAFPADATPEDKVALIGASLLVDVVFHEQDQD